MDKLPELYFMTAQRTSSTVIIFATNLSTRNDARIKGLVDLSKCEWITYSRLLRVEKVTPPGFEPATCISRNRHANKSWELASQTLLHRVLVFHRDPFEGISYSLFSQLVLPRLYLVLASCTTNMLTTLIYTHLWTWAMVIALFS